MHGSCLGVCKNYLEGLSNIPEFKMCIDQRLKFLMKPEEMQRLPGNLSKNLKKYKASELRSWLLYLGPAMLVGIVSNEIYLHFALFHYALRMLLMPYDENRPYDVAEKCLNMFVSQWQTIFPFLPTTYNVHSLVHYVETVRYHRCSLDIISAFLFESYLKRVKTAYHGGRFKLEQVFKRLCEELSIFNDRRAEDRFKKRRFRVFNLVHGHNYYCAETDHFKLNLKNEIDKYVTFANYLMKVENITKATESSKIYISGPCAKLHDLDPLFSTDLINSKDVGEYCHLNTINPFQSFQTNIELDHSIKKVWFVKNELITVYSTLLHVYEPLETEEIETNE